ncbi:hypothetical protein MLD38_020580 [Melastoma candidum]|uniref:Uncharacterized protein n=1 Tax=Melastoma candidum TaxID=119954 RepID=A0ACB9QCX5_9MYRT|nr:hypothetical protein MLD38_020580 [Melastoma candidum]
MATTTMSASDSPAAADRRRTGRAKRKKHHSRSDQRQSADEPVPSRDRWRSESQHKLYSTKLMEALSRLHIAGDGGGGGGGAGEERGPPLRGRTVREAADRALAFAAKGRTRWSRAVLMKTANRVKLKFRKAGGRCAAAGTVGGDGGRWRRKKGKVSVGRLRGKGAAGVQSKVRVLGGLVPGCRKEPMKVVLEEATDYIAALEMQVRTMNALAQLLSRGGSTSGASSVQMSS